MILPYQQIKISVIIDVEASMSGDISLDIESTSDYNKKILRSSNDSG